MVSRPKLADPIVAVQPNLMVERYGKDGIIRIIKQTRKTTLDS